MNGKIACLGVMLAACTTVFALTEEANGIEWTYQIVGEEAEIYNDGDAAIPMATAGAITVPDKLGGKTVTSIREWAFRSCSGLTSVTIPDGVTSIGGSAFSGCSGLTSVTIPASVTSIGANAFSGCSGLTSVTIPASVTSIGDWAFSECPGLTSVTVPQCVLDRRISVIFPGGGVSPGSASTITDIAYSSVITNIGGYAFSGCSDLTSVAIPDGVTSIGNYAFSECSGLTSVTIPASVTSIGAYAFSGCSGLTSVTIPASVTSIGNRAFSGCESLNRVEIGRSVDFDALFYDSYYGEWYCNIESVEIQDGVTSLGWGWGTCQGVWRVKHLKIPASVTDIGTVQSGILSQFSGLETIEIDAGNASYASVDGLVLSKDGKTLIGAIRTIKNATIPAGVTSIGAYAFSGFGSLTNATIPAGVTDIGAYAFSDCWGLTSVTIPAGVTSIGDGAFSGCYSLTSVTIPAGVMNIGDHAFYRCAGLKSIDVAAGNAQYSSANGLLLSKDGKTLILAPQGIESVTIPGSVTTIGTNAFLNCEGLTSVTIPDSVTSIGEGAFENCCALTGAIIPDSVTSIGKEAFEYCESLKSVTIGKGVGSLADYAFYSCKSLSYVVVGRGVKNIGGYAFSRCYALKNIVFEGDAPTVGGEEGAFDQSEALEIVTVNSGSKGWDDDGDGKWQGLAINYVEKATVTVTFNANGGAGGTAWSVATGSAVGMLPMPTRSGYEFDGWYTAKSGGTKIGAAATVAEDVTYYAHWNEKADGGDDPEPTPGPTPGPGPKPTPGPSPAPDVEDALYGTVEGAAPATAASEYNGYLVDTKGGVQGTIQVKVGKPGNDGMAAVKATVILAGGKKSLKAAEKGKAPLSADGPSEISLVGGETCSVTLGAEALSGKYGSYRIDGVRNFFASKDKTEQGQADAILGKWLGAVNVVWGGNVVTVTIAKKGKAKVKGVLADGKTKVSANAIFLVGEEWCCVPVLAPKAQLAFGLWLSRDGRTALAAGLDDALVGKAGALAANAAFRVDASAALWTKIPGTVLTDYLPDGVAVETSGAKWVLPKAGKVAMKDGVVDATKLLDNPAALKLSYKAADGSFKGSFKVYAESGGKVKATTVNVTGVMIDGKGYGTATVKKVGDVPVTVE